MYSCSFTSANYKLKQAPVRGAYFAEKDKKVIKQECITDS